MRLALMVLFACLPLIPACSDPPTERCAEGQVVRQLRGFALEERSGTKCISQNVVLIGEYCLPDPQSEDADEYSDGETWVWMEPHYVEAIAELRAAGFERLEPDQIPWCQTLDAAADEDRSAHETVRVAS